MAVQTLDLDEEVENVKITVSFLMKNGMLELNNTDEYLLTEVPETIGSETAGAERVRKFRNNKKALQCNTNVTECNTEIDKEIESELDKESNGETEIFTVSKDTVSRTDVQRAVKEWNSLAVYGLRPVSKLTSGTKRAKCLNARIKEYGIDEVLAAIERIKNSDFLKGNNKSGWMITFDWFVLPNNFKKVHDRVAEEYKALQDKKAAAEKLRREKLAAKRMEQTKKAMEEIFSKNDGVDAFQIKGKGLILVVPQSGDEIRKEGEALDHCVGGYVERVAKGETNIFFVRKADHPEQSYFTMEWKNNKVVQCRGKSNCGMPPDVKAFVQVFEKKMQDAIQKGDTNGKKKQNLQSA